MRVLRSCLHYLSRLDYNTHKESINNLLKLLEDGELFFPYQIASVLETMVSMHPKDFGGIGHRIRRCAFGKNLEKKSDWLVIQKGLEALMSFPYKDKFIPKITSKYLDHEHPMVKRAALTILTRSPKNLVRERLNELKSHPDHDIAQLAFYFDRMCNDQEFATSELKSIRQGNKHDISIVRHLHQIYSASATNDSSIAKDVLKTLESIGRIRSAKLTWHFKEIRNRVEWAIIEGTSDGRDALRS